MPAVKDLTGQTFGRLTALRLIGIKHHKAVWLCRCLCGNEVEVLGTNLLRGITRSCGCLLRELLSQWRGPNSPSFKHGRAAHDYDPTYKSWHSMTQRVTNPNDPSWMHYGGETPPVTIDPRWMGEHGFEAFLADMGERPSLKHSLGRFGDIGDYCKENCAWQTSKEQHTEQKIKRARIARQLEDQVLEEMFGRQAA